MRYQVRRHRSGAACVRIAPVPGIEVSGLADNAADAADRGLAFVEHAAQTPLGSLLPPGTADAARLLRNGVRAAARGEAREYIERLPAKARKHVVSFLHKVFG